MRHIPLSTAVFGLVLSLPTHSRPVKAQPEGQAVYAEGSIWSITFVDTSPGRFDDYIQELSGHWRGRKEFQKKKGDVLSYKIMYLPWKRDGEPGLILMTEYKNMASFDREREYWEEMTREVEGSIDAAATAHVDRGEMRTLRGSFLAREVLLVSRQHK